MSKVVLTYTARKNNGVFHSSSEGLEVQSSLLPIAAFGKLVTSMESLQGHLNRAATVDNDKPEYLLVSVGVVAANDDGSGRIALNGFTFNVPGSAGVLAVQRALVQAAQEVVG